MGLCCSKSDGESENLIKNETDKYNTLEKEKAALEELLEKTKKQCQDCDSEKEKMQLAIDHLTEDLEKAELDIAHLHEEAMEHAIHGKQMQDDLTEAEQDIKHLQAEVASMDQHVKNLNARLLMKMTESKAAGHSTDVAIVHFTETITTLSEEKAAADAAAAAAQQAELEAFYAAQKQKEEEEKIALETLKKEREQVDEPPPVAWGGRRRYVSIVTKTPGFIMDGKTKTTPKKGPILPTAHEKRHRYVSDVERPRPQQK